MQLEKLDIKGFKSFGDKITINFNEGVTAIVGPNGCGKSNVVDAIRWVLGEQSTRMLRSEKMENIIFNGTKNRKPSNLAEVSLTFDNTKNILPTAYSKVTITRKLYRTGESEYRLNDVGQGLNASSAVGLRQLWKVSEALTLNTGIEQVKTLAYDDSLETARAYNLGFLHQPNTETKWGGKLELRDSNISQQWLGTAAFDYKMSDEWTAIARDIYIAQNYKLVLWMGL